MPYDKAEAMTKRELIAREVDRLPEQELDRILAFVRSLKEADDRAAVLLLAAESALGKDWLTPEEDAAWAKLYGVLRRLGVQAALRASTCRRLPSAPNAASSWSSRE